MNAPDVIHHSRSNQQLALKNIPERQREGILPTAFLHARALEIIEKDESLVFHQKEDFTKHFIFYSAFRYSLVDDRNAYIMLTCSPCQTKWFFDTNVNKRINSGLQQAA